MPVTRSLEEENRRLREELARSRQKRSFGLEPGGTSQRMAWLACALCVAAVLFAAAILFSR